MYHTYFPSLPQQGYPTDLIEQMMMNKPYGTNVWYRTVYISPLIFKQIHQWFATLQHLYISYEVTLSWTSNAERLRAPFMSLESNSKISKE